MSPSHCRSLISPLHQAISISAPINVVILLSLGNTDSRVKEGGQRDISGEEAQVWEAGVEIDA